MMVKDRQHYFRYDHTKPTQTCCHGIARNSTAYMCMCVYLAHYPPPPHTHTHTHTYTHTNAHTNALWQNSATRNQSQNESVQEAFLNTQEKSEASASVLSVIIHSSRIQRGFEDFRKLPALIRLNHDITPAEKLSIDVNLGKCWPLRVLF